MFLVRYSACVGTGTTYAEQPVRPGTSYRRSTCAPRSCASARCAQREPHFKIRRGDGVKETEGCCWLSSGASSCLRRPHGRRRPDASSGPLKDPQGAVLPGATVTIDESARCSVAFHRSRIREGVFRFLGMPSGRYIVKVELSGFKTVRTRPASSSASTAPSRSRSSSRWPRCRRDGHRHGRVADHRHGEHHDRRERHRRAVHPHPRAARLLRDRARRAGHADDAVGPAFSARPAPRTSTSSTASTRPASSAARRPSTELRLHPGSRGQDRRSSGRVRPHDRRHHQRPHQVRRQHLQGLAVRLLRGRRAAVRRQHRDDRPSHDHQVTDISKRSGTSACELGGFLSRTSCGSSAPTTASRKHRDATVIRDLRRPAAPAVSSDRRDIDAQPVRRQADLEPEPGPHADASAFGDPTAR